MTRFEAMLVGLVVTSSVMLVQAKHEARLRYLALETQTRRGERLDIEWRQLQLERATLVTQDRIQRLAQEKLGLASPRPDQIVPWER